MICFEEETEKHSIHNFRFYICGYWVIGVILPVLPTTPLLLASFFFTKGSERFNAWFMSTKLYKNYIEDFVINRSMTLKTKIKLFGIRFKYAYPFSFYCENNTL